MEKWIIGLLLLVALNPSASAAVRVDGLFDVTVAVSGQAPAERARALSEGLKEVISRLAATQNIDRYPPLQAALADPSQFVQQYRYQRQPANAQSAAQAVAGEALWMRFDRGAIEKLLRDNGLPVWGAERPNTLVWLAVEDGNDRHLIAADSSDPVRVELEKQAQIRGVPIMFPLLDLKDQRQLSFADVWGGFADTVAAASARYSPEAVLIGRLRHAPDGSWDARWLLTNQGQEKAWTTRGADLTTMLGDGIGGVADALAARYAMAAGQGGHTQVTLTVAGVAKLQDYAKVGKYLTSLAAVVDARLTDVAPDQISYTVDVRGNSDVLAQSFALGDVLVPVQAGQAGQAANITAASVPSSESVAANAMHYRLQP